MWWVGAVNIHKNSVIIFINMKMFMQSTYALRDDQWDKFKDALPGKVSHPGRSGEDNRLFCAMMYVLRTGIPWRDLPKCYGT